MRHTLSGNVIKPSQHATTFSPTIHFTTLYDKIWQNFDRPLFGVSLWPSPILSDLHAGLIRIRTQSQIAIGNKIVTVHTPFWGNSLWITATVVTDPRSHEWYSYSSRWHSQKALDSPSAIAVTVFNSGGIISAAGRPSCWGPSSMKHRQDMHIGKFCPPLSVHLNRTFPYIFMAHTSIHGQILVKHFNFPPFNS